MTKKYIYDIFKIMVFKRLELYGFKSFAEKTRLDFEAGVTSIVGPNGCGKSNIADSIKWVLGEQSVRSMRGSRMEDVIFHGADGVPPVGFAEVSLTISNQQKFLPLDYEEITITRRIFRSGESEYLINKVPVRLKDVLDLFMDTGIGMHSYSLMEQGKVDQILNSRPEERREIFEEASGITKYKSRKEEALRKLERTRENLQRLNDIILEVKRQIKSIERQVNKARRYKQEFDILKGCELKVARHEYLNLKKEKKELEEKNRELEKIESSLNTKMRLSEQTLKNNRQDLSQLEEDISKIQAEGYEVCTTINTTDNKITLDRERIEELTERKEELKQQIEELKRRIAATCEQIREAQAQIENVGRQRQLETSFVKEKEENIDKILTSVKEARERVTRKKEEEVEVIARQAKVKNDLTKLEANLANLNARLRRLNIESDRTGHELNSAEERYKGCIEELKLLNGQLKQLNRTIWDLKSNLDIKLEKNQRLKLNLEKTTHQIASLQSRLDFLKEITKKYEGFSSGVKAILSARDSRALKIEGLYDVVANLVEVSPEYRLPIEMALGGDIQAIVVENYQVADAAISYLKAKDKGQANFICLDSLKLDNRTEIRPEQILGEALEFVKTEPRYHKLMEHLLASTFVVPDLETARRVLKDVPQDIRLVTLNGEILTRTSIIGGSLPGDFDSSLLGRQRRIEEVEDELERMKRERENIESLKTRQDSEIKRLESQIQQKEPDLNRLRIKLANKETEKSNIEAEKKRLQDEISVLELEIDETNGQIQQLKIEQENLNRQLFDLREKQKGLQEEIQKDQNFISEKNQERQNILVEIAETKARLSALDREEEDGKIRLQMVIASETEQRQSLEAKVSEVKETDLKIEELKQQIQQLKLKMEELSGSRVNIEGKLNQTIQRRRRLSAIIQQLEAGLRENQKQLDEFKEKRAKFQLKYTELNYKQDSLKNKMQQSYQVELEKTLDEGSEIQPLEPGIFDEINRIKRRLEEMGPVNLVAIEENDQMQQRYSFLVSQQEDLIRAQESLRKAIAQINQTARRLFAETFQKIQVSFKEYFRILFGGGDARLILLDENNILETGIEIVVRPPGKRLQNISLLSGGERALTAIALLFAIFKVRPSPFCILDEVDAPLDEANTDRFTNLLSEFVKTSQFIIITHNKKTINMADIMYGITMEKSGVSKIVSVKLTDEKKAVDRTVAEVER